MTFDYHGYQPKGDKKNSAFFDEYRLKIYERRKSSGLEDLLGKAAAQRRMKQMGEGRRLDLAGMTPDVAKVFRLTRMDSIFTIHEDMAAALQRVAG